MFNRSILTETDSYLAVGHSARLLNLAADGQRACDGKEVSAFFNPVVVVAQTEVEICCDMRADVLWGINWHLKGLFV